MNALIEITKGIIEIYGYTGIFIMTTLEQFIFPIPADIFITMGTSNGLSFSAILWIVSGAAVLGSLIGYYLGKYLGHPIMQWLFGKRLVNKGEKFMKKWGIWGVIIAGISPLPFKIITWSAGIFEMPLKKYLPAIIIGRIPRYILSAYAGKMVFESKFYLANEINAFILGALQGVTEFLPISSSGHLVLMEHFLNLSVTSNELITFDIFLHGGSLLAIIIYFWKDWVTVLKEVWESITTLSIKMSSLTTKLALATIPAIIAGLAFGDTIKGPLRNLHSVAIFFIIIAIFFFYSSYKGKKNIGEKVPLKKAIIIGCAQAFALIPGISRSGTTIGSGILLGLKREAAARFSFLLGGIAILAANVYALISIYSGAAIPSLSFTLVGFFSSFIFSLISVNFLIKFLQKHTMNAFGIYLILMGIFILSFL